MTDPFADLDTARSTVRGQLQAARERNAAVAALTDTVNALSATVKSSRGEVTVTATPSAAIPNVTLDSSAFNLTPDALSRLVTETIARAQRAAAELALTEAQNALGEGSNFVSGLRADVDSRFGPLHEEPGLR